MMKSLWYQSFWCQDWYILGEPYLNTIAADALAPCVTKGSFH